jgi:MFS transporter, PPP family, 3-phenylpropionic acid transporter
MCCTRKPRLPRSAPAADAPAQALTSMPQTGKALWPFAAMSASYFAHIGFFNPYLPLWLQDMGLSLLAISLLTSIQASTRLFAPYAWGALSDHTGERTRILRFCALVAFLSALLLFWPWPVWMLALVLFVMFTHTSSMMPMTEAAMAHLVSADGKFDARRYGRVRLWGSLGFLVTVLFAGVWFEWRGMQDFPAWTVISLLCVLISVACLPDLKEAPHPHDDSPSVLSILQRPPVRWFFTALFFHVLAHIAIFVFYSLYLDKLGYGKAVIGLLWGVSVVVEIAWFFVQSRWFPRFSLSAWLVIASAVLVLRMAMTAWGGGHLWVLFIAQCLHAITFAAHHMACIAMLSHYFPGRLRGRGQALYTTIGYGFTGVTGALLGGWISQHWGLHTLYLWSVVPAVLALACALVVWRLRPTRNAKV